MTTPRERERANGRALEKLRAFDARLARLRERGTCVGIGSKNRDCPQEVVAVVEYADWTTKPPDTKCQYHLDVLLEFAGGGVAAVTHIPKADQ